MPSSEPTPIEQIRATAIEALFCDGAHHKQWYLEQIAMLAGFAIPDAIGPGEDVIMVDGRQEALTVDDLTEEQYDEGMFYSFERGIAP